MDKQTLIAKLTKTAASLNAHIARGNRYGSARSNELCHRYDDLKDAAPWATWEEFCKARCFATNHTAYDYFCG